jgi:hypothetical protein
MPLEHLKAAAKLSPIDEENNLLAEVDDLIRTEPPAAEVKAVRGPSNPRTL